MQVVWAVKHSHIGDAFFDLDAAAFLCTQLPQADSPAQSSADQASTVQHSAAEHSAAECSASHRLSATGAHKKPSALQHGAGAPLLDSVPDKLMTQHDSCHAPQSHQTVLQSSAVKKPLSRSSAVEASASQEVSAGQTTSACANNSATPDSADEQAASPAQDSAEDKSSAQDPSYSQQQLPQRTRQQRRGLRRRTDGKSTSGQEDQPDLSHGVKVEQVCDLCLAHPSCFSLSYCIFPGRDAARRTVVQDMTCTQHVTYSVRKIAQFAFQLRGDFCA